MLQHATPFSAYRVCSRSILPVDRVEEAFQLAFDLGLLLLDVMKLCAQLLEQHAAVVVLGELRVRLHDDCHEKDPDPL